MTTEQAQELIDLLTTLNTNLDAVEWALAVLVRASTMVLGFMLWSVMLKSITPRSELFL